MASISSLSEKGASEAITGYSQSQNDEPAETNQQCKTEMEKEAPEKPHTDTISNMKDEEEKEYLKGPRLLAVMAGIMMCCLLVLLDSSILSTVSPSSI
jgi:hypothetical protein